MARNLNICVLLLTSVAVFSSCNGFLDKFPLDKESLDTYFQDESQMQAFSNAFYPVIFNGPFYDAENDLYFKRSLPSRIKGGTSRPTPSSGGGWNWSTLRDINTMIAHIADYPDEAVREEYTGLARFFRAYFYYKMVRDFSDVPWYDHELGSAEDEQLYTPRDPRELVMSKMVEDVDYAIAHLSDAPKLYRVTKWTALAFKSRFCLFEGTWRKYHGDSGEGHDYNWYLAQAADAAKEFITTSPYTIHNTGNEAEDYTMVFSQQSSPMDEVILAKNYSTNTQISHFATFNTFCVNGDGLCINKKYIDSFLMKDGTRFTDIPGWETMQFFNQVTDRDPRLAQIIRTPGYHRIDDNTKRVPEFANSLTGYQSVKYAVSYEIIADSWQASDNDMPIYRAAEVYLNYAEAMAERTDVKISQADLDLSITPIRKRAGMPELKLADANANPDLNYMGSSKYGFSNVTGDNKGVILEIRRERMVELAQEGDFRWYDLMRWKEGKCIEQDIKGMYFPGPGEYDFDGDGIYDFCLYDSDEKPQTSCLYSQQLNKDGFYLTEGTSGYVDSHRGQKHVFDEKRDYLYPIPTGEIALNPALTQNPGWKDIKR